jgi:hypothetical protein
MKKSLNITLFAIISIIAFGLNDTFARSYSSSRSYSSRSYSSSRSNYSTKPSTKSKYAPPKPKTTTSKPKTTTAKKTSGGFGRKKVDTKSASYKKTNAQIKKDFGTTNKKYKSVKAAKADLSAKMAKKTYSYNNATTAMSHRPAYIPTSYNGYHTTYHNGHYGYYGLNNVWIPYLAMHMLINDEQVHAYAPNTYVVREHHYLTTAFTILTILFLGTITINVIKRY